MPQRGHCSLGNRFEHVSRWPYWGCRDREVRTVQLEIYTSALSLGMLACLNANFEGIEKNVEHRSAKQVQKHAS